MTFRRNVRLNPGRLRDLRGRGARGGGLAVGGGLGSLVILAILLFTGVDLSGLLGGGGLAEGPVGSQEISECRTGEDANERQDCRLLGALESLDEYWAGAGVPNFQQPLATTFSQGVNTGCGSATSQVGPFYCPVDQTIYIDLSFYDLLEGQFGAQGGPLAEMYVAAHEYGHHIQNLTGALDAGRDPGAEGGAVRTELQADCFAGVWVGNAVDTGFLEPITQEQINQALSTAEAIGDDHIQQQTQGGVNQDTWTHGSSDQRQQWFMIGYERADPNACDTFNADI